MINKSIPNFRVIFGGLMPQTRRRRWIRSSGDSTWPAQEQMTGDSSSHAAAPQAPTYVNWDDDMDDFMPPNHGLQHMMFLPLYVNLDPEKREREREERTCVLCSSTCSSSHAAAPQAPSCVNLDDDMDDFMRPQTMASNT